MGFLNSLFGNKARSIFLESIQHNTDIIERDENRTRNDAEYLAICIVLDDLAGRTNGQAGYRLVMDMLSKKYSQHQMDVVTYLAAKSGQIVLKPEAEQRLIERHRKRG